MSDRTRMLQAAQRQNLHLFIHRVFQHLNDGASPSGGPYLEALSFELQQAAEKPAGRLLITMPPRHLKSIAASVALVAWKMGHKPSLKVLVACYGEELAREHSVSFRRVVTSSWYRELFPNTQFSAPADRLLEMRTTAGGMRKAVSVGGATTGFGADLIIIDDILKAQDAGSDIARQRAMAYVQEALLSRFDDPRRGVVIAVQQRLHEADLPALLIESGIYRHLNLPAITETTQTLSLYNNRTWTRLAGTVLDPDRLSLSDLEAKRREIGAYAFSAQYLQNPVPPEGAMIRIERLTLIDKAPDRDEMQRVVQSWDTAIKDKPSCDYSVCTTWGWMDQVWYLLDVQRVRLEYPELKALVRHQLTSWRADKVIIEDGSNGHALWSQLRRESVTNIILLPPTGTKIERLSGQLDMLQSPQVVIPSQTPWWNTLLHELRAFPNARHDDQIDSISQFLRWMQSPRGFGFLDTNPVSGRRYGRRQR